MAVADRALATGALAALGAWFWLTRQDRATHAGAARIVPPSSARPSSSSARPTVPASPGITDPGPPGRPSRADIYRAPAPGSHLFIGGRPMLTYFRPGEFFRAGVDWWPLMSAELLTRLDTFRARLGAPVEISPAEGAVGRRLGRADSSQHNIDRWGEVRAIDVMPVGVPLERAYQVAREVGFTGIGLYPDWSPRPGLHLDVREDRTASAPALWAGINDGGTQRYVAISRVIA